MTETLEELAFSYQKWYDLFTSTGPKSTSEKVIARMAGVSERVIRKARIGGWMDEVLADALCVRVLHVLPHEVYGDHWFDLVDYDDDFDEWYAEWAGVAGIEEPEPVHVPTTVEEFADLYRSGMSLEQIGELAGWSAGTIRNRLVAAGVELRPRGRRSTNA